MLARRSSLKLWLTLLFAATKPSKGLFPAERVRSSWQQEHIPSRQGNHPSSSTIISLAARKKYQSSFEPDDLEPQRIVERPTFTLPERPPLNILDPPSRKKILVLGASGKIGRLVVRHLLESPIDATIVAYCRNYDKACRVLFDDMIAVKATATTRKDSGPTLQIVQGELVQPGRSFSDNEMVKFLTTFYNHTSSHETIDSHHLYSLAQAMNGASVIISCVGSTRHTNLWKDLMERPLWRLLRPNVETWCLDSRHPYYVHYLTTRVALRFAEGEERERRRRLAEAADNAKRSNKASDPSLANDAKPMTSQQQLQQLQDPQRRLRFIRISDLSVGQPPWHIVPLFTNMLQSMVLRYQEMAEAILQQSPWIDTIVLRPGDLVSWNYADQDDYDEDEMGERDTNTTAIQVGIYGRVPEPSRIGRDDVAALAVAAALHDDTKPAKQGNSDKMENGRSLLPRKQHSMDDRPTFHYTLACRWVGEQMHPFPPQGRMSDGHVDAGVAMRSAMTALSQKNTRRQEFESRVSNSTGLGRIKDWTRRSRRVRLKPYGLCVAVPTYFFMCMLLSRLVQSSPAVWDQLPWLQPFRRMTDQPWWRRVTDVLAAAARTVFGILRRKTANSNQYIPF